MTNPKPEIAISKEGQTIPMDQASFNSHYRINPRVKQKP